MDILESKLQAKSAREECLEKEALAMNSTTASNTTCKSLDDYLSDVSTSKNQHSVDNFYRPSLILCAQFFVSMITDL
jgi:hypothetical protein